VTAFAILAGLLALVAGIAIAWPILRARSARGTGAREANLAVFRDQLRDLDGAQERGEISAESHARAMEELRQRVAEDADRATAAPRAVETWRWAGWIAAACVPALAALIYVMTGNPAALDRANPPARREAPHALAGAQMAGMAERLASRLRSKPEDAEGWATLGRSLAAAGRFGEAADALAEAARRMPGNATILAEQADVLAMSQGRRFDGEPDRLVAAALAADPRNVKALALAGTSAYARGDFAVAAGHWRRLLALVPVQGEMARQVEATPRSRAPSSSRRAGRRPSSPARSSS